MAAVDHDAVPSGIPEPAAGGDVILVQAVDFFFGEGFDLCAVGQHFGRGAFGIDAVAEIAFDFAGAD